MAMGGANAGGNNTGATQAPTPAPGVNPSPIQNPYAPVGGGVGFGQPTQSGLAQNMPQQPTGGKGGGNGDISVPIPPGALQALQGMLQGAPSVGGQSVPPQTVNPDAGPNPYPLPSQTLPRPPVTQPGPQTRPSPDTVRPPKTGGLGSLTGRRKRR